MQHHMDPSRQTAPAPAGSHNGTGEHPTMPGLCTSSASVPIAIAMRAPAEVAPDLAIHVILDNYATHKHPTVRRWLTRHPRVHFHFTPPSASRLNLVERVFGEPTEREIRRLTVTSVAPLIAAIMQYIDRCNEHPTPFVWTASVRQILKKVGKANATLATLR